MQLLNRKEAAELLKCSVTKIRKMEEDGYLIPVKLPQSKRSESDRTLILYDLKDIERLIESSKDTTKADKDIFYAFEYVKDTFENNHDMGISEMVDADIYNHELTGHLHFIKVLFPEEFENLEEKYKKYHANHVEKYLLQKTQGRYT